MARRHKQLKRQAAGKRGKTEVPVKVGRKKGRYDAERRKKAIEIERGCDPNRIKWALQKLAASNKSQKTLKVNYRCIPRAEEIKRQLRLRKIKITKLTAVI